MPKSESQIIKGVAILMMIYVHLFNHLPNVELCHNFIYINNIPLIYILSEACNPVPFFLIIGGYGLYKVWQKGDKNRWRRILKLYVHWWIIMSIFVLIGHFIHPQKYPGSLSKFILNAFGLEYGYNAELWFLFPYILLSICSPYIFKILARTNSILFAIITFGLFGITSIIIKRHGESFLFSNQIIYGFFLTFHLLFNFSLGAIAAKCSYFEKIKKYLHKSLKIEILSWGGVFLLIIFNCAVGHNYLYSFLVITCLSLVTFPNTIQKILVKLGDHSMNMWMIHTWFCYYLFKDFIYSFKYPIIIFLVLTAISYLCSIIINFVSNPIERLFMTKRQAEKQPIL